MISVFTMLWAALAVAAICVWVYGVLVGYREDDTVHLAAGEEGEIVKQAKTGERLAVINKWRNVLSLSTVVGGVLVLGLYLYDGFTHY